MEKSENIFVIETCENCRQHNWNTRHDENKYKNYALESNILECFKYNYIVSAKITEMVPNA